MVNTVVNGEVGVPRHRWTRVATILSVVLFLFHAYAFLGLAFMYGTSLVPALSILSLAGPPMTVLAIVVSAWRPKDKKALLINSAIMIVYLIAWIPLLSKLEWSRV